MPTEDRKKVLLAVSALFPNSKLSEHTGKMTGKVGLSHFKELAEKEKIRAAVEAELDTNIAGARSHIDLNKTAAYSGKVGLDEQSPIGKIRLYVAWERA